MIYSAVLFFVTLIQASSDTLSLSLEQALNGAVHNNPLVYIERIDVDIARRTLRQNGYEFEPAVSATVSRTAYLDKNDTADAQIRGTARVTEFLPTGTGIVVEGAAGVAGRGSSVSSIPGTQQRSSLYQRSIGLTLTQALLQGGWPCVNLVPVRKAAIDIDIRQEELAGYSQKLLSDTERAYWDAYLAGREAEIHSRSLALAQRQLFEAEQRLAVGSLAPLDLAIVKAEAASREKAFIDAKTAYTKKKYQLFYLINDSTANWEKPLALSDTPLKPLAPDSLKDHLTAARTFRPDIREARYLARKGELDVVQTRNGFLPKLDAFIALSGTAYAASFSDAMSGTNAEKNNALTVGLSLSFPASNGAARQKHHKALLSRRQIELSLQNLDRLIQLEVSSAWIETLRAQQQIAAAQTARKLQEEKVDAEQQKFSAGKSTEYFVLQAQRDLIQSQLDEARAEVAYSVAVTDLYLKDGTLLERRGVDSYVRRGTEK